MLFEFLNKQKRSKETGGGESYITNSRNNPTTVCKSHISVSISTNPGLIRDINEDNFFASDIGCKPDPVFSCDTILDKKALHFFAVFDGMGGEAYGDLASEIASETLREYSSNYDNARINSISIDEMIKAYVSLANKRIYDMIIQQKCNRSGCTMAMIVLWNEMAYAFSIGDSRIYRCNHTSLEQISEDQTLAIKKLKANIYSEDEARSTPDAHKLTSYIGIDNRGLGVPFHAYEPFSLSKSIILLCSDGLTDMCTDDDIQKVLSSNDGTPANSLVNLALKNGGEDNVTCVVIKSQ